MSRPRLSFDELLDQHVLLRRVQRLDDRLGDLDLGREDDADALRALEQLDDDGRAADPLDRRAHVGAVAHERRRRHADVVAREDLVARSLSRAFEMPFAVFGV